MSSQEGTTSQGTDLYESVRAEELTRSHVERYVNELKAKLGEEALGEEDLQSHEKRERVEVIVGKLVQRESLINSARRQNNFLGEVTGARDYFHSVKEKGQLPDAADEERLRILETALSMMREKLNATLRQIEQFTEEPDVLEYLHGRANKHNADHDFRVLRDEVQSELHGSIDALGRRLRPILREKQDASLARLGAEHMKTKLEKQMQTLLEQAKFFLVDDEEFEAKLSEICDPAKWDTLEDVFNRLTGLRDSLGFFKGKRGKAIAVFFEGDNVHHVFVHYSALKTEMLAFPVLEQSLSLKESQIKDELRPLVKRALAAGKRLNELRRNGTGTLPGGSSSASPQDVFTRATAGHHTGGTMWNEIVAEVSQ